MLQSFRLIALVALIACREVISAEDKYFGCHRNVDAICATSAVRYTLKLTWAERLHRGKRDYVCRSDTNPICCNQGMFDINATPNHFLMVVDTAINPCSIGGQ
ncbi:hypothetical protein KEM48_012881 [Puccinia striiformis f. sp. tritici PST-130]|uniref:Hydrophobin n=1 Tax=Puccinia striiformis f. sp. tritici PST-78 TaxID=1165861 RepID=A0A0L0V5V7_9BASI|nr:hypothetical protein Pst134EB_021588 [Puccinia striiformis f. sp. tritici]KAI9629534.1 hypothetical protein KEM48_012881 [Puccinia striiformis f. sp. tritici PST-130]KNE94648.1 hypothetical protein PSTG_12010 [Puccinia striiformis f. sp. tritici PST-78]